MADRFFVVVALAVFAAACLAYWPFVADDALIVGRYALNAAEGIGLVYNAGEPVLALTSPLQALVETALAFLWPDPVALYRLLAPALVLLSFAVVLRVARFEGRQLALFAALAIASPFLALWTVGGLETPMLALVISSFSAWLLDLSRRGAARTLDFLGLGVLAGLAFLTRHDSILVTLPPLLAIATVEWRRGGLWAGAAVSAAIAGAWLGFAQVYYGDVLPTSTYVKLGEFSEPPVANILASLNFLLLSGLWLGFFLRWPACSNRLARAVLRGTAVSAGLLLAFGFAAAGQHMMFGYRFFVPYLPAMALVAALALRRVAFPVCGLVLATQIGLAIWVSARGMNPFPIGALPVLGGHNAEWQTTTPTGYGKFLAVLRADATELRAHWAGRGRTRPARIFLYTGGTGYWLRDFYVFETLVSYRHNCGTRIRFLSFSGTDYVQDIGSVAANDSIAAIVMERSDLATPPGGLSRSAVYLDTPSFVAYWFGTDPDQGKLPPRTTSACTAD